MSIRFPLVVARPSFLQQLVVTFTSGIICLSLLSSLAIATLSDKIVREKLIQQGLQATEGFAGQSTLALLYASTANAEGPARETLAFPDVRGVAIYASDQTLLFAKGDSITEGTAALSWPQSLQLDRETAEAWYFVAPVFARRDSDAAAESPFITNPREAELIGYVRVAMSKDTLKAMGKSILRTSLSTSTILAAVLLLFLLLITQRLTTPLKHLANIMGRASAGEKNVRAKAKGPKDIVDMETAFNSMMDVLETRERQLEKARDTALESARMKSEFAANVSHELRTPLNGVLGMLELLRNMELTAKQVEYVNIARNAGEALLRLIEDILDFSRIEAGMMKLRPTDFVLHEVLDEVVGLLAGQAQRKGLELSYMIADGIPLALRGEAARVRQILINLVGNAIKFTAQGSIEIRVLYQDPAQNQQNKILLRFEVVDTGIGIPVDARNRIFDAFVQVDGSNTRRYEGAGLGLAICQQLTKLMGGEIGVDSELNKGSRFWFSVPFEEPTDQPAQLKEQSTVAGLRILIVTDNDKIGQFLLQTLGRWEINQRHVEHADQALEVLQTAAAHGKPYQFAIVDRSVPEYRIIDLVRNMAQNPALAQVKVILLSAATQNEWNEPDLFNVAGYLNKPVQSSLLYDCILSLAKVPENLLPPETDTATPLAFPGKRVLIVEDNRASQQVAIGMLEHLGCRMDVAGTGLEALDWLTRGRYDLVLMDCHMPQMNGFEATRQIRAMEGTGSHIPIIAMTANAQQGDSDLCLAAGMDDYLSKPLKLNALRDKLKYWLTRHAIEPNGTSSLPENGDNLPPPLDSNVLRQLRDEIGDTFFMMVQVFFEDSPDLLRATEQAIAAGDSQALCELAHSLKGAGRNFGANRFGEIAKHLEDLGRSGTTQEAKALFADLSAEYERVKAALEKETCTDQVQQTGITTLAEPLVLIADDDRAMLYTLHDVLIKDGYRIEQASTGMQALAFCERQMPDLILLDAMMPEMDGFAVCARIRQSPEGAHTPIIIVTALDDKSSIDLAFSSGATDYIPKPVHFAVLRQRVARLLDASRAQEHLNRLAYEDGLTGLPNRALFMEKLEAVLNRPGQEQQQHAVLFLDLDRFKLANDTLGHEIGDLLLKAAAERIQGAVRTNDLVSRFGGDEFTLLLEDISSPNIAATVAEKICRAISAPYAFMGREVFVSSSIGISLYPNDGRDGSLLIKHADIAMYCAKEQGNSYRFYEGVMEQAVSAKVGLENDLRRAIERNEFFLLYQPQLNLITGKVIGMEALIRWQHPERGLISPLEFIPLAEETSLIDSIGLWVLRNVCIQNKAWQQAGLPHIPIAVNLSARQFDREDIVNSIIAILNDTGLEPQYLELELTESTVMRNPEKTRAMLRRLQAVGTPISIDDFGTGYSSLSQLKHFPFDKLKIDKSFVSGIVDDSDDAAIALMIISIARNLKIKVIAEGVETEQQLAYLRINGCDEIQGYFLSRPIPANEAAVFLQSKHFDLVS